MSSQDARLWFKETISAVLPEGCTFQDSSNVVPDLTTIKAPWVSIEFISGDMQRLSIGKPAWWEETGRCYIKINTASGMGEEEGMVLADLIRDELLRYKGILFSEARLFRILTVQPVDNWMGLEGRFFVTTLPVDFILHIFQ